MKAALVEAWNNADRQTKEAINSLQATQSDIDGLAADMMTDGPERDAIVFVNLALNYALMSILEGVERSLS